MDGLSVLAVLLIALDVCAVQDHHLDAGRNYDEKTGAAGDPHALAVVWLVGFGEDSRPQDRPTLASRGE